MSFGLVCGRMVTMRGRIARTEGVSLPDGNTADIEDGYKYFGIPQANRPGPSESKASPE